MRDRRRRAAGRGPVGRFATPDGPAWETDTMVETRSAVKGVTAACLHLLVDRGLVDLDAPVRAYWPELRADPLVRHALTHEAGIPVIDAAAAERHHRLADHGRGGRATGTGVGTGRASRVSRRDLRVARRRDRAPGLGPHDRPVPARGDLDPARRRLLHRHTRVRARPHRAARRRTAASRRATDPDAVRGRAGSPTRWRRACSVRCSRRSARVGTPPSSAPRRSR